MAKDILSEYSKYIHTSRDTKPEEQVKLLKTKSWGLHHLIGLPGVPIEHIIEVYGPPTAGKTTLTNHLIGEAQKETGKPALYIDPENKYMLEYGKLCGVNIAPDMFYLAQSEVDEPLFGEEALQMMVAAVQSKRFSSVTVDSIGGLTMRAIFEGDVSDAHVGLEARIITKFVKQLNIVKKNSGTLIIAINQIRSKIGGYGSPETTGGGFALEHLASLRLRVGRGDAIELSGKQIGYYMNITCRKNNFGEGFRTAKIPLVYNKGVYPPIELLLTAKDLGLVTGSSGNYKLGDVSLGRGVINASKEIMKYAKKLTPRISKLLLEEERKNKLTILD